MPEFSKQAFDDLLWWVEKEPRKAIKLVKLIREAARTPFEGTGKPEALRHELAGLWSRRIDHEHRLVYRVEEDDVIFVSCRDHYR